MLNFLILNENMALADCRFLEWNGSNPGNKNLFLDSSRLFVFKISGGQLIPVDLQGLAQRKSN